MDAQKSEKEPRRLFEKNWFLLFNLFLALGLIGFTLIIELSAEPPFEAYQKARKAVSLARKNQANIYMADELVDAEYLLEQSKLAWQRENRRWRVNRNFYTARRLAAQCSSKASHAAARSIAKRDSLRELTQNGIREIKAQIEAFRPDFQSLPLDNRLRQKYVLSELNIMESEAAFKRQDYKKAAARYKTAADYISRAGNEATATITNYYANAPKWRQWVQETLRWSKENNDVAIVVDKIDHECYLYSGGEKIREFSIELGPNWIGHKLQRGDNATPEGCYRIRRKKANGQTKYYLAMEIDYPNDQDRARFYAAKARGEIAGNATIGGLIEIHGDGGKGANWTAGCVALSNRDMEKLFKLCKVGTPVTIVGSTKGTPVRTSPRSLSDNGAKNARSAE